MRGYSGGSTGVGRGPRPGQVRQRRRIWSQCIFQDLRWFQEGSTEWRKEDSRFGMEVPQKEGKDRVAKSETRRGPTEAAHSLLGAELYEGIRTLDPERMLTVLMTSSLRSLKC